MKAEFTTFLEKFSNTLELNHEDIQNVTADSSFRYFDVWDSLSALMIIAMIEDEYGINLSGEDIKKSETFNDLIEIINNK
jgi:acyl carrier protein